MTDTRAKVFWPAISKKSCFSFQQDHDDVKQPIEKEVKEESLVKDESSSVQSPRGAQGGIQVDLPQILGKQ